MQKKHALDLSDLAARPLAKESLSAFLEEIQVGVEQLHGFLQSGPGGANALERTLAKLQSKPRHRRALELCAWPLFDKLSLPAEPGHPPAALRLFSLPVLVQFANPAPEVVLFPGDFLPTEKIIEALEAAGVLEPTAIVSGLTSLFSKEDLQSLGPLGLANVFFDAETSDNPQLPDPLPVVLDPEIESSRAVVLHVLLAARVPVDSPTIFALGAKWPISDLNKLVEQALLSVGIPVDHVQCLHSCTLGEASFRCAGPAIAELAAWLELGKLHYGISSAYLSLLAPGQAELVGVAGEDELLLAPTFSYVEPPSALQQAVAALCEQQELSFAGARATVLPTSEALH